MSSANTESSKKDKKSKKSGGSSSKTDSKLVVRDLNSLLKSRFFVVPSFDIYGGKAGFFDLGPPMAGLEQNVLQFWRKHFIQEEHMIEISCSMITPYVVLESSGHVSKFTDLLVYDSKTGTPFRADHLVEDWVEKALQEKKDLSKEQKEELEYIQIEADAFKAGELKNIIDKWNILSPEGNKLTDPTPFNMMFETKIGPTGKDPAFLRPEIAQGMFTNYKYCYEYNNGRLPFAAAQFGRAFRNEIAPKGGLFRLREFTLAEFEHFYDPEESHHAKFEKVKNVRVRLISNTEQEKNNFVPVECTIEEAHLGRKRSSSSSSSSSSTDSSDSSDRDPSTILIQNETLAYFLARSQLFFLSLGLKENKLRFRQHLRTQLAHYAKDCWDCEALTVNEGGKEVWVEITGIADRSCSDLAAHSKGAKKPLTAQRKLEKPKEITEIVANKQIIGKQFKSKAQDIIRYLEEMEEEEIVELKKKINNISEGKEEGVSGVEIKPFKSSSESIELTPEMISFKQTMIHLENYLPHVIEPSFGISRIIFAIVDQNFFHRDAEKQRAVISFPPFLAPFSTIVLPLQSDEKLKAKAKEIEANLTLPIFIDSSSVSIGKRYSRADEIGVAFAITVDYISLEDDTVTIRERDSAEQIRVSSKDVSSLISNLISHKVSWKDLVEKYGLIAVNEKELE